MLGLVGAPSILIQTGAESWGRFPVPRICRWESRVDTKCPEIKEMCKIMFYNQLPTSDTIHKSTLTPEVGRFHIGALTNVEPGHWGGHQVSGHGRDM